MAAARSPLRLDQCIPMKVNAVFDLIALVFVLLTFRLLWMLLSSDDSNSPDTGA